MLRRVIIESPYAGDIKRNIEYARRALYHSIRSGEAPFASHLLYPQALDESKERSLGIVLGYNWWVEDCLIAFYVDYGMSQGMGAAFDKAVRGGFQYCTRKIGLNP